MGVQHRVRKRKDKDNQSRIFCRLQLIGTVKIGTVKSENLLVPLEVWIVQGFLVAPLVLQEEEPEVDGLVPQFIPGTSHVSING